MNYPVLYKSIVSQGLTRAKESSIAICILAKNCEKHLAKNLKNFSTLADYFKKAHFFIAENDSIDNTKKIIKKWALENPKTCHLVDVHNYFKQCKIKNLQHSLSSAFDASTKHTHMSARIMRMATIRDATLDKISKQRYKPQYLLMCDADVVDFSIFGVLHSLGQDSSLEWDGITANGRSFTFYWAKRILPLIKNIYHDSFALSPIYKKAEPFSWQRNLQKDFSLLKKGDTIFPVNSAFGGMALYKYKSIQGISYRKNAEKDKCMFCEHVSFHKTIHINTAHKENKIYINPSMLLYYNTALRTFLVGFLLPPALKKFIKKLIQKNESQ